MTNLVSVKQISNHNLDKMKTEYAIIVSVVAVIVVVGLFLSRKRFRANNRRIFPLPGSETPLEESPGYFGSRRISGLGSFRKGSKFRYSYNDPLARERSASEIEREYV